MKPSGLKLKLRSRSAADNARMEKAFKQAMARWKADIDRKAKTPPKPPRRTTTELEPEAKRRFDL